MQQVLNLFTNSALFVDQFVGLELHVRADICNALAAGKGGRLHGACRECPGSKA